VEDTLRTIRAELTAQHWDRVKALVRPMNPVDVAGIISDFPAPERALLFRLLDKDQAVAVFEYLPVEDQQALLESFKTEQVRHLVENMSPDDRADLLDELPAKVAKRLLALLTPEERHATLLLLGYREDTAGGIMTPEYIDLKSSYTVAEALNRIRRVGLDKETIYYCYVTDEQRRLQGIVSLRQLVLAAPDVRVADLMEREVIYAVTDEDQEEVARKIQKYDLLALPVVDRELRLVGIVTHDDVLDILQEEATEDIYRLGAVQVPEQNYFRTGIVTLARNRVGWLMLLLVANTVTGSLILRQSQLLESVIALTAFIPLLIGSGGNIGSQTSTVFVRGLALQEVTRKNALLLILREVGTGLLLGCLLATLVTAWAYWLQGNAWVALTVGVSLVAISTFATLAGSVWPLVFHKFGLDPALISAPLITTLVDILGVFIYLQVARLILSWVW